MDNWKEIELKYKRADEALDNNEPSTAAALLGELVQSLPTEPLFHWRLGFALSELGRHADAICEYKEALRLDPANVPALGCLGRAYMELKQWSDAENAIRARLSRKESPQHYVFLADILMEMGRYAEAIEAARKATQLDRG